MNKVSFYGRPPYIANDDPTKFSFRDNEHYEFVRTNVAEVREVWAYFSEHPNANLRAAGKVLEIPYRRVRVLLEILYQAGYISRPEHHKKGRTPIIPLMTIWKGAELVTGKR